MHPVVVGRDAAPPAGDAVPSGRLPAIVARVSGSDELLARAGRQLPEGASFPEAVAVRARREGGELRWGEPERTDNPADLIAFCRDRGYSAIELARADPSLILETQIGTWFDAGYRRRIARRTVLGLPLAVRDAVLRDADLAFWSGARSAASKEEWERLTRNSYVALLYHRLAGEQKLGQEKLDIAPERFGAHLRLLRRLRFSPLRPQDVIAFHRGELGHLPRRSFALTLDDGTADCAQPLLDAVSSAPQLFVPTAELGGKAHWLSGEELLSWDDVVALAQAGVAVGAHGRRHRRMTALSPGELADELGGSFAIYAHTSTLPFPSSRIRTEAMTRPFAVRPRRPSSTSGTRHSRAETASPPTGTRSDESACTATMERSHCYGRRRRARPFHRSGSIGVTCASVWHVASANPDLDEHEPAAQ